MRKSQKKIENEIRFVLRIEKDSRDKLELYSKSKKISMNTAINWAIDEFCANRKHEIKK